jgi:aminoglycoside phosphotransferase (APT) family kinase protein
MFKSEGENGKLLKVAMLDWQTIKVCSPAVDVSYFILACSPEEDLIQFDGLLKIYYNSFSQQLKILGSDAETVFPFSQFINDFKLFAKYGLLITMSAIKAALSDKEEAPDVAETAESGFEKTFSYKSKNQSSLKSRMLYIVKHAAEQGIL